VTSAVDDRIINKMNNKQRLSKGAKATKRQTQADQAKIVNIQFA